MYTKTLTHTRAHTHVRARTHARTQSRTHAHTHTRTHTTHTLCVFSHYTYCINFTLHIFINYHRSDY